jgi:hypothetical protein
MSAKIFRMLLALMVGLLPATTWAGAITVDNVAVSIQPVGENSFQLLFKFELPQLPAKVNIDYAVLSFGVNIANPPDGKLLEILSVDNLIHPALAYNSNPVTGFVPKERIGLVQIDLELTQLVDLWVNGGGKNEGVLVISHRRLPEKALQTGKIILTPDFKKPAVTIFYTETE